LFHSRAEPAKKLAINQTPAITVTGKAFLDVVILLKIKN
jgi:hypothetical protein